MLPTVVSRQDGIEQSAETRGAIPEGAKRVGDVLAVTIAATLDNELVAERAQILGKRLRESAGADPTVAFLENGSASGSSGRAPSNP